jgi:hypothetical protein
LAAQNESATSSTKGAMRAAVSIAAGIRLTHDLVSELAALERRSQPRAFRRAVLARAAPARPAHSFLLKRTSSRQTDNIDDKSLCPLRDVDN